MNPNKNESGYVTLSELIADKAETAPDLAILTFVTVGSDGQLEEEIRTYRQLYDNGQALARGFVDLGMSRGDKLAVMMRNHPEFVETMVASGILGTIFVPIDPRTMGVKLSYMLNFTDCKGVICADYALDSVLSVVVPRRLGWLILFVRPAGSFSEPCWRNLLSPVRRCIYPRTNSAWVVCCYRTSHSVVGRYLVPDRPPSSCQSRNPTNVSLSVALVCSRHLPPWTISIHCASLPRMCLYVCPRSALFHR